MKLSELKTGETAVIVKIRGYGEFRHRITEMGFVKGKEVYVVKHAPLRDPIEYRVMGYDVSLRHTEADLIEVVKIDELGYQPKAGQFEIIDREKLKKGLVKKGKNIHVAFVGNPNAGKTTLFNALSGSHEKVGNYGGVTVDLKQTVSHFNDHTITFVDLPGTYSLSAYSQEEVFVRNYIFNKKPDIVVNVVDSGNFERNLYLTTQLIDMDIKVI
ncbi:MAG TPA: FeoB small GTPase domain-containing protein, partial [Salinivirgaceae bacterium]|nr:FeoB small GTPase domain-containing protein [Salinivirgaceae bacterium]